MSGDSNQRDRLKLTAFVDTLITGALALGYITSDTWLAALRAIARG